MGILKNYRSEKLIQCPFCGADAEIGHYIVSSEKHRYYVGCSKEDCCDISKAFKTEDEAINYWNRREGHYGNDD